MQRQLQGTHISTRAVTAQHRYALSQQSAWWPQLDRDQSFRQLHCEQRNELLQSVSREASKRPMQINRSPHPSSSHGVGNAKASLLAPFHQRSSAAEHADAVHAQNTAEKLAPLLSLIAAAFSSGVRNMAGGFPAVQQ